MKRYWAILLLAPVLIVGSCQKNTTSKIPKISLIGFQGDSVVAGSSTQGVTMTIHFVDGDADEGVDPNNTKGYYDIYLKDSRYDTGYVGYFFPTIDPGVENSSKGIEGIITFTQRAALLAPRPDSIHTMFGDTLNYEIYIADRARNTSNHVTTPNFIIRP